VSMVKDHPPRSQDLTMKAFEHTATVLGTFRRALDLSVLETSHRPEAGLRLETSLLSKETLGLHQMEKRTPLMHSTGALVLRVMETEAPCTIAALGFRETGNKVSPAPPTEARGPRVKETEAHPTEAPGRLKATAFGMTMFQLPYHTPVPQANGCMVLTLL